MDQAKDQGGHIKVTVTVPKALAHRIKRYWHKHELASQSEAWRQLVEVGLTSEEKARSDET